MRQQLRHALETPRWQAAAYLAQVVAHEVGVLGEVNRLQCQPPQPLTPVDRLQWASGRGFGTRRVCKKCRSNSSARLWHQLAETREEGSLTSCCCDTKPLPGFEPAGGRAVSW